MTPREKWIDFLLKRGATADEAMADVLRLEKFCANGQQGVRQILGLVESRFAPPRHWITTRCRDKAVVRPRQIVYWLAHQVTPLTLREIGTHFGGKDHTTVLNGIHRIDQLRARDPALNSVLQEMVAITNGAEPDGPRSA